MRRAIQHLKKNDAALGEVISRVGAYKIEYREPNFDTLVRSIVYQQVSGNVARVIVGRLLEAMPERQLTAANVLRLRRPRLRKCGLSEAKTDYIRDLARHASEGNVVFEELPAKSDEEVIEALTRVKGIGVWTAQMFLIFALRRSDVLPVGDLGVRKAMMNVYGLPELPKPAEMERIAAPWRPYCSVASWYLWRSLDGIAAL
ncbi:MAG: DNA-3-methyladenine glycosylase 2 family protein [Bryobacterales bacterium]|nr:DNA-3-methyladenine glycosylase 2 family protein [Bryobacterales bacterium]